MVTFHNTDNDIFFQEFFTNFTENPRSGRNFFRLLVMRGHFILFVGKCFLASSLTKPWIQLRFSLMLVFQVTWCSVLTFFADTDETKDEHDLDQEYEEISGTESPNPNLYRNSVHFILDERGVHLFQQIFHCENLLISF